MEARLYVVHGSHPCATVEKALEMKGVPYRTVELPPPMHAAIQRVRFGSRTVPALRLNGEKLSGSRAILRRLEELRPDPPLYPADAEARAKVEEAERWGEEILPADRPAPAVARHQAQSGALASYSEHSKLPLPAPMIRLSAPMISRVEMKLNAATPEAERTDLARCPSTSIGSTAGSPTA